MKKVSTERKLRKKYAPLTDSLQQLVANEEEMNQRQQQQQQNEPNQIDREISFDDADVFNMPPPPFPPPQLPLRSEQQQERHRRQQQRVRDQYIGPLPPVPPRSRSRSPHLSISSSPPRNRENLRRFSLPQPSLDTKSKRPRSMTSSDGEVDVFNPTRYKSEPKLPRLSFEPIEYDIEHQDNMKNEQIDTENPGDGAWGGFENKSLSRINLKKRGNDDVYVEYIRHPSTSNSTEFIAKSLDINKKNRSPTSVVPQVQFGKMERKRSLNSVTHDEVDSSVDILKTFKELSEKKIDGLNNGNWSDIDEKNYKEVVAILSINDFDENGKFVGGSTKRRKVVLALSKFNKKTIQKIKAREKSMEKHKEGRGLEKNFIPYSENIVYEYWDDPNELCERLQLLLASKSAGNTNHDQEINSIIEELKERKIIV